MNVDVLTAIQMGRPSKTRAVSDRETVTSDGAAFPVNLLFQAAGSGGALDREPRPASAAGDRVTATIRDVVSQLADSTADCSSPAAPPLRKRSAVNVLRQLQSQSASNEPLKQSLVMCPAGGENFGVVERQLWSGDAAAAAAADLRVKRARHAAGPSPLRAARSPQLAVPGRPWSGDLDDSCPAMMYGDTAAVGSPSVTSSGRRDSLDDDDEEEDRMQCTYACTPPVCTPADTRSCTLPSSVDVRHLRRRSSDHSELDKKQTGLLIEPFNYTIILVRHDEGRTGSSSQPWRKYRQTGPISSGVPRNSGPLHK